jgi:hypothetical protein
MYDAGQQALNIALINARMESYGHMALEWLWRLDHHHGVCSHIESLLCPTHSSLAEKFNLQLSMLRDSREMLDRLNSK